MAYAVPPGEDDDLLNVLKLAHRQLPTWVNKDDLYRDLPQIVAADCFQATDGAGTPACYILTPLRSMGGRTSRAAGAGYWKVEKTVRLLPTADEASSSKPAPEGTCAKLSFISRPPNGPGGRNGWLMKQYLLPHAPGTPAGPALCKLYFKKSAAGASTAAATTAAAAAKAAALLVAAAAARPLRQPASTPCASPPCKVYLKKPAAEVPSTAAAAAKAAAAPSLAATAPAARPLRLPASTCRPQVSCPPLSTSGPFLGPAAPPLRRQPASPPLRRQISPATSHQPAEGPLSPSGPCLGPAAPPLRRQPSAPPLRRQVSSATSNQPSQGPLSTSGPCLGPASPHLRRQPSAPPLRRQVSSATSNQPAQGPLSTSGPPSRRWILVQTEGTTPPPKPHHDRVLKRIYEVLQVDEVEVEEGEVMEQGEYLKKRTRFCCDKSSYLMLKDVDFQQLNAGDVAH